MAAKERSERSGNFTTLKFQVVRIWNLANLTLEEIFPDWWFPVLLHLDFGYLDYWASTHICSSCREYYFKYKELTYLSHTLVCTSKFPDTQTNWVVFTSKSRMCVHTVKLIQYKTVVEWWLTLYSSSVNIASTSCLYSNHSLRLLKPQSISTTTVHYDEMFSSVI